MPESHGTLLVTPGPAGETAHALEWTEGVLSRYNSTLSRHCRPYQSWKEALESCRDQSNIQLEEFADRLTDEIRKEISEVFSISNENTLLSLLGLREQWKDKIGLQLSASVSQKEDEIVIGFRGRAIFAAEAATAQLKLIPRALKRPSYAFPLVKPPATSPCELESFSISLIDTRITEENKVISVGYRQPPDAVRKAMQNLLKSPYFTTEHGEHCKARLSWDLPRLLRSTETSDSVLSAMNGAKYDEITLVAALRDGSGDLGSRIYTIGMIGSGRGTKDGEDIPLLDTTLRLITRKGLPATLDVAGHDEG